MCLCVCVCVCVCGVGGGGRGVGGVKKNNIQNTQISNSSADAPEFEMCEF